jgi:hypothetical protein
MDLLIPDTNIMFGQVMHGELVFQLTEETRADALYVGVRAEQEIRRPTIKHDNYHDKCETHSETVTRTLFHSRVRLDGERMYSSGFYNFELRMPFGLENDDEPSDFDRVLEVVAAFRSGVSTSRGPIVWELYGELDIPWSSSLSRKIALQVHPYSPHVPSYSGAPGVSALETVLCQSCHGPYSAVYGCGRCEEQDYRAPEAAPRFCTQCGEPRPESARYCRNCGTRHG